MGFEILTPESPDWLSIFNKLPLDQQDVFYHPGFAKLNQLSVEKDHEVLCAAFNTPNSIALYPFAKRELGALTGRSKFSGWNDITGLYGRGGIVASWGNEQDCSYFHNAFQEYCRENKIICGFDRFHPLMKNEQHAPSTEKIMEVGGFVVVDLRPEIDEIQTSFKQSVRKDIRKAKRNEVTCFYENNSNQLDIFLDIYKQTMDRNSAGDFYYFAEEYFNFLGEFLPENFHFFYAMVNGEVVSCELVLHHGKFGHSFLGGTKREALPLGVNPYLKWTIIRTLKKLDCEYFLLGGGSRENDGVFNFKKAYALNGVYLSRIGGTIWNLDVYDALKKDYFEGNSGAENNRFQFYDEN